MKKLFLLLVAVLTMTLCASAQTRTVTGTVIDANTEEPLIGASVTAGNSNQGVATDYDGAFSITVPTNVTTLTVSYVGYEPQHVKIVGGPLVIKLRPSANALDEVIAVAYGTVKKSEYTGSASVVKADQLEDALVTTVTSALSGRVAGVMTLSSNGQPGAAPSVLIRGVGSINAGTQPLYVVDGVPYAGDIAGIPTTDIESMTVLKDAASAALYGARGANGVILITTKHGSEGTAKITVDARWGGNSRALPNYDVVTNPRQYLEQVYKGHYMTAKMNSDLDTGGMSPYQWGLNQLWPSLGYQTWTAPEGQAIIGTDGRFNPYATPGYYNERAGYYYLGDDWGEQLTNGLRQEYNISINGGTDKFTYYLGASYLGDEGIITGSHYKRFSTRAAVDYQAKPWLKIGTNISYTYVNTGYPDSQTESGNTGNAFYMANSIAPVFPMYVRGADGNIAWNDQYNLPIYDYGNSQAGLGNAKANGGDAAVRNVMSMSNPAGSLNYDLEEDLMDIFDGKWYALLTPVEGLTINGNVGYFVDNSRNHSILNGLYGQFASFGGQALQVASRIRTLNVQALAEYQHTFGNVHNAGLMIGYESFDRWDENVQAIGNNLYNPNSWAVSNTIDQRRGYGSGGGYATRGYFGRLKYNYDERYFFMGSFRRDASSRFHPKKRWGNFWSASVAWDIAKEKFMEDFTNVDLLKFKFSFGQNGNDNIGNYYAYMDQYSLTGSDGVFNDATLAYKGNPDITWETSNNLNVGFDFSFFKGGLSGSLEYYQRQVSDMLFNLPVAPSLGYSSIPSNVGSMRNYGAELDLNYRAVNTRDITWDIYANFTLPANKVIKLSPDIVNKDGDWLTGGRIFHEGQSMYQLYLVKYAGVDPDTGEALYWAMLPEKDANGNTVMETVVVDGQEVEQPKLTEQKTANYAIAQQNNRQSTGNLMPKGYGGFGTQLNAYGFDLAVQFAYQFGGRIYDNTYSSFMHGMKSSEIGMNIHKDLLNAWDHPGQVTDVPRLSTSDQYTRSQSTRFLTSSNYLSLNNITFGYTLPEKVTAKAYLSNVRFYFSAENVALWSKRKGLDPRQSFTASSNGTYSPIRCFSGGVRLSF
ncbi:MAG: TonB-dependent receptor [Muribaculaceae bacterium]|nr:TonB-dependent receptor [Muribaculaceae bacterium]